MQNDTQLDSRLDFRIMPVNRRWMLVLCIGLLLMLGAGCSGAVQAPGTSDTQDAQDAPADTQDAQDATADLADADNPVDSTDMLTETGMGDGENMGDMGDTDHMTGTGDMGDTDHMTGTSDMGDMGDMGHGSGGANSAAYMTLINETDTPDAIIRADTDVAETVELHTVEQTDEGIMKMRPVEQIDIPASGEQHLKPGGFHIMLLGLKHDLNEGDTVTLTLTLEQAGDIQVIAPVSMMSPYEQDSSVTMGTIVVANPWVRAAVALPTESDMHDGGMDMDESSMQEGEGMLQFHANGEDFVRQGMVSKDGWSLTFDHVYVTLSDVTAYQADPPYDAQSEGDMQAEVTASLDGKHTVDLAEGDANAEPVLIGEVAAPAGRYNALSWNMTEATEGPANGAVIMMQGVAEKDDQQIDFTIALNKAEHFICGDYVGDERKGIVEVGGTADVEATFHFDHLFGDAETPADDTMNTDAVGFAPFAAMATNGTLNVDMDMLLESLPAEEYEKLVDAHLAHVGEGHCASQNTLQMEPVPDGENGESDMLQEQDDQVKE